jgi:DNA-binding NtrC family response regulator
MARTATRRAQGGGENAFRSNVDDLVKQLLTAKKPWALRRARRNFERAYVEYVISRVGADRVSAAGVLDIGFSTLKEKIRKSGTAD